MLLLGQIRGQERAVAQLRRALAGARVAHAYLFTGPAGCGKHTTGLAFAAALNCLSRPGEGCTECEACAKIAGGIHPDVQTLAREGAAQIIPIDTIRAQVIPQLAMAPHEGRARVFLVEEATALQGPAANALLKTLEEPPARTHFILGTAAPDQLLPTIRSRCQRVSFAPLAPDVRAQLADEAAAAARLDQLVGALAAAVDGGSARVVSEAAADASRERAEVAPVLELLAGRYHVGARRAAEAGAIGEAGRMSRRAAKVIEAHTAVTLHNAHGQIALEALVLTLRAM
ncbi:MAG TPA: DNA polymerase III subunit delta' [Kofleriaceae bacterium]|jgi:DNA polymerase-3 subunit delta'|nr:DNA polymerase III subunit delta' [Kofleriaceae bacterium]